MPISGRMTTQIVIRYYLEGSMNELGLYELTWSDFENIILFFKCTTSTQILCIYEYMYSNNIYKPSLEEYVLEL